MLAGITFTIFNDKLISHMENSRNHYTVSVSLTVGGVAGGLVPRVLKNTGGGTVLARGTGVLGNCLGFAPGLRNPQFKIKTLILISNHNLDFDFQSHFHSGSQRNNDWLPMAEFSFTNTEMGLLVLAQQ